MPIAKDELALAQTTRRRFVRENLKARVEGGKVLMDLALTDIVEKAADTAVTITQANPSQPPTPQAQGSGFTVAVTVTQASQAQPSQPPQSQAQGSGEDFGFTVVPHQDVKTDSEVAG